MEFISSEKRTTIKKEFEIHFYRDNNNDEIVICPFEIINGKTEHLSHLDGKVPMKGVWNLAPEEYENFEEELAKVKWSLELLDSMPPTI